MQDNYVGDIGDYGKYGLLRNVTVAGLRLAVNWYRVIPTRQGKQRMGNIFRTWISRKYTDIMILNCLTV